MEKCKDFTWDKEVGCARINSEDNSSCDSRYTHREGGDIVLEIILVSKEVGCARVNSEDNSSCDSRYTHYTEGGREGTLYWKFYWYPKKLDVLELILKITAHVIVGI